MRALWSIVLLGLLGSAGCLQGTDGGCVPRGGLAACGDPAPSCRTDNECAGDPSRPVCDAGSRACRGCQVHGECALSGACRYEAALPDAVPVGQCYRPDQVAVVDGQRCSTSKMDGTAADPYCEVQDALDKGPALIVVRAKEHSSPYKPITIAPHGAALAVTILGPGRDAEPQAVIGGARVSGLGTRAAFIDLAISSAGASYALSCTEAQVTLQRSSVEHSQGGVSSSQACQLTIDRSRLQDIRRSAISAAADTRYRIVNSLIAGNGADFSAEDHADMADVALELGSNLNGNVFSFNTLVGNIGMIDCRQGQTLRNSLVTTRGPAMPDPIFRIKTCGLERMFVGDEQSAMLDGQRHLTRGSSCCIDQAQADDTIRTDYDGTPRPQGAGYDIGCFEFR